MSPASHVVLPDCRTRRRGLRLSPRQRRELVRVLAEEGADGVDAWLRRETSIDPDIRERVEAERAALEREALAERRRLEARHADEERAGETAWEKAMREATEHEADLSARLRSLHDAPVLTTSDLLARSRLYQAVVSPGHASWPRRALAWLRRVWIVIVSLWVRFVRWVTRRGGPTPRHVIRLPDGVEMDLHALGPDALVALRPAGPDSGAGWRERMRRAWDRLLGRADYAEHVARLMEEERKRVEAARAAEKAAEEQDLQRRLDEARGAGSDTADALRQEAEARRRRHEEERRRLAERVETEPLRRLRGDILERFEEAGLVDAEGRATEALVSRFARSLYDEARRSLPAHGESAPGTYVEGEGEYEVGPMHSQHEIGAMELVGSLVQARLRHPHQRHLYDDDVLVHREVRMATAHVVLVFDTSGSMEEHGRLDAAKRVALVLHRAVKDRNPDHRVDLLRMHTSIEHVDLADCWQSEPMGFTNHGAALREARKLFDAGGADQRLLYVITDGLPEAYTKSDGTDKADRPDVCMQHALAEAEHLRGMPGLRTTILQLETKDPKFIDAARRIAEAAGGTVEAVDPNDLMTWMLGDYDEAAAKAALQAA